MLNDSKIAAYTAILQEELLLATGCTEPIAVAYCAAKLREVLGGKPEKILAEISGNILKNVKSVVVPNTGGRRGIDAAIAVGIVAGDADAELQVIANVTEADVAAIQTYLDSTDIRVTCPETPCLLDIKLTGWREGHHACVPGGQQPHEHHLYGKGWEYPAGVARHWQRRGQPAGQIRPQRTGHHHIRRNSTFGQHTPHRGAANREKHRHRRRGAAKQLGRQHRLHPAGEQSGLGDTGAGMGGRRLGRTDERLRDAGGHRIRLRQSGHHRLGARMEIRQAHGRG